jgi:hypothetical protein
VLLSLGDDRWAYQKVGLEDKAHLLQQPITPVELQALVEVPDQPPLAPTPAVQAVPTEALDAPPEPTATMPEKERKGLSRWVVLGAVVVGMCFVLAVVGLLLGLPSGDEGTASPVAVAGETAVPADTVAPQDSPVPTNIPQPTDTPLPTEKPKATGTSPPAEPSIFLNIAGTGETVSEDFEGPECFKAVFLWSVESKDSGLTSLTINLHNVYTQKAMEIVSTFETETVGTMRGESIQALLGGAYYVTVEDHSGPWALQGICREGEAPSGEGIDLHGVGQVVSGNVVLTECQKSVFVWSVEPRSSGLAQLEVSLANAKTHQGRYLVSEFEMDVAGTLSGEVLEPVSDGMYFIHVESASGPWTLRWDCRD